MMRKFLAKHDAPTGTPFLRLALRRYFLGESIFRLLIALPAFFGGYPLTAIAGLAGGVVSGLLYLSSFYLRRHLLILGFGYNWAVFMLAFVYLFGWAAGFQEYVSCLVFAVFLFDHLPLRRRIFMALFPLVAMVALQPFLAEVDPVYELPGSTLTRINLANTLVSLLVDLAILVHFAHRIVSQRERLAAQAEARGQLIAELSHELKTPLAAMLTRTQLELKDDAPDSRQRSALKMVERNARGAAQLVERMLDFHALEADQTRDETIPSVPAALIRECWEMHEPLAAAKGVSLKMTDPDERPWQIDPHLLRIALNNLLSNAIHHSPEGGTVTVTCLTAGEGDLSKQGTISVRDEGEGIPEEALSRLFDAFYRGDRSRSRKENRHGLGLSIAQRAVERMGGRIEVQSTPGEGAEFFIHL